MRTNQLPADVLALLKEPFASKEVRWVVARASADGRRGLVRPYADPRAYTDRLDQLFTAGGWTRQYRVTTVSPVTRIKGGNAIQSGKLLVTCNIDIPGLGRNSGSGEAWADEENAMTRAEAQAFKRACSCFGMGRYFYSFPEIWIDLDESGRPFQVPELPSWALRPEEERAHQPAQQKAVVHEIQSFQYRLGDALYQSILKSIGGVDSAQELIQPAIQRKVLRWLGSGCRGLTLARKMTALMDKVEIEALLMRRGINSLDEVPDMNALVDVVRDMQTAQKRANVA